MGQFLLVLVVAIVAAAIVFGVVTMIGDGDAGLGPAEPDGRAVPLPGSRPLAERDVAALRFDTAVRGYRMEQVDQALRRAAYDIGYKDELITVLEAEVDALRGGRQQEADELRAARTQASARRGAVGDDTAAADESDTDVPGLVVAPGESGPAHPGHEAAEAGDEDDAAQQAEVVAGASRAGAESGR